MCKTVLGQNTNNNLHDGDNMRTLLNTSLDSQLQQLKSVKLNQKKRTKMRRTMYGYIRSRRAKRKFKQQQTTSDKTIGPSNGEDCLNGQDISKIIKTEPIYRKYRNSMLEIITQNEILDSRTRTNRRASQPFMYSHAVASKTKSEPAGSSKHANRSLPTIEIADDDIVFGGGSSSSSGTKTRKKPQPNAVPAVEKPKVQQQKMMDQPTSDDSPTYTPQSRTKRRINYSEELVDEAFKYEQMLLDKQQQEKESIKNASKRVDKQKINPFVANVSKIDSRLRILEQRNEISIMPVKSRLTSKENVTAGSSKMQPLFNITSSVSVHIKNPKAQQQQQQQQPQTASNSKAAIQIAEIKSLYANSPDLPRAKRRKIVCKSCDKVFDDEKKLAVHSVEHMKLSTYRVDSVQILNPKLRRVRQMKLNMCDLLLYLY